MPEIKLGTKNLIHDHDIVVPDIFLLLEHLDLFQGYPVLFHRDAVLNKPERLQEAVACRVRQRQASLVDIRTDFHIIA